MLEYKQGVSKYVPVRLFDQGGIPISGIAYNGITAAIQKADGSSSLLTVLISDWTEIATGPFVGSGVYLLKLGAGNLDQPGLLTYAVSTATSKTHIGAIKVVANEEIDTYSRIGAPVLSSISADVAGVKADVAGVQSDVAALGSDQASILAAVNLLKKYEEGRWKIHITGGDANRLVLYDTDNVTPLLKFDLKDSGGAATFINPYERYPVP